MTLSHEFLILYESERDVTYSYSSRTKFLKKTIYHTLMFLALTTITTLLIVMNKEWNFILNQNHYLLYLISLFIFLSIYGIIITLEQIRFMKGINYIAAFLLSVSLGILIAIELSWYTLETNINSIFISSILSIIISAIAFTIKRDFTIYMNELIISTFVFMVVACLVFIFSKVTDASAPRNLYCLGGFLLSCAYIVVDTQSISTKDRFNQLNTNEYVLGGVKIFVDYSYLFYYCMGVMGSSYFTTYK